MENSRIADLFDEIGDLLELKGENPFRVRSYRNAARTIRGLSKRIEDIVAAGKSLEEIPNIGESIAKKIEEMLETGSCKKLQQLRKQLPPGLPEMMEIQGLGPRKVKAIHDELGVEDLAGLKEACEKHRIRELEGFGQKTEEKILKGLATVGETTGRILRKEAAEFVESIARYLEDLDSIKRWAAAGSYRRKRDTVGDLDILVAAGDRERAGKDILDFDEIADVIGKGREKISVTLQTGLQVDFRFFEERSFGAALLYFTGSKSHNIALRKIAQNSNWKLNEYGIFKDEELLAGESEEDMYSQLDIDYIPPALREDRGEIQAAQKHELPELVEVDDIKGDLHAHTKASDGNNTIREMAEAAKARGYQYLAITDHSQAVRVAKGMDDDRLLKQAEDVRRVNEDLDDFWILAGIEVDILKDGALDISPEVLADLDWVCASAHFHLDMDEKSMTKRVLRAIESGVVNCIGHPLGRLIGRRDPIALDMDKIFQACKDNDVFLEINSRPKRLDLPDIYVRQAARTGVTLVIDTDAHKESDLELIEYGVGVARRGWLEPKNVLNTLSTEELRRRLLKE